MWIEEAEELFKGYLPYYLLIVLPMFIIISPINPVSASYEFPVYRMQHFDLHGSAHGCRSASVNLEARSLSSWGTSRHCVVTRVNDLTIEHFRNVRSKAGALLIVLPEDISSLTSEENQHLMDLEDEMLSQEISFPVYFVTWTLELEKILDEVASSVSPDDKGKSAAEMLFSSVAANGYQVVINPRNPNAKQDIKISTIQGNIVGQTHEGKTQTIAVVAHYDSFGVAPELSFGADSNASGVAMLLEIMRLFSLLYADPKTHGKYNIIFLLTGGGKLNYQGSKKWLEDQLDSLDGSIIQALEVDDASGTIARTFSMLYEKSALGELFDASYVMCLDTLASSDNIFMHVSKPPKEGSSTSAFFKELKATSSRYSVASVEGIHKKINLADDLLAWEHERYSIRRLPAFTLSSLKSHKDLHRGTITDTKDNLNLNRLVLNANLIVDTLVNQIYNVSGKDVFGGTLRVEEQYLTAWIDILTSKSRAAQLLSNKDSPLVNYFKDSFSKYLRDVRVTHTVPDKRDPDFMFYDVSKSSLNVYSVKPAVFDLILTLVILLYLGVVFIVVQNFSRFYELACNITIRKSKVN